MKKYSANNYSKYRKDLSDNLNRIGNKMWDKYTRDELIVKFMPLVEGLARKFSTSTSASGVMTVTDMIQEGHIGLIKAVDKIIWATVLEAEDPERRLKSFLAKRIKGAIRRAVDINRGSMRIPEHKLNEIRKDFGKNKKAVELYFSSIFTSIDAIENQDSILQIPDETKEQNNATLNAYLLGLLKEHLTKREADVIKMSYGLDCEKHSATEIANHLGINGSSSYVRVSQLKKQAIDKLINNVDHSQAVDFL
jgi:RNA polymerase sigma factor (sigma-70 family)